jgi:hypothetical protein
LGPALVAQRLAALHAALDMLAGGVGQWLIHQLEPVRRAFQGTPKVGTPKVTSTVFAKPVDPSIDP